MANKQNFEQLLEYIVNGEQEKAEELFHALVVGKSREIYEGLFEEEMKDVDMDESKEEEEEMEEAKEEEEESVEEAFIAFSEEPGMGAVGGDPTDDMMGDVGADDAGDDFGGDMDDMGDAEDDMGGEGDIEDRVMDLEDALEDLKAEFDALMADEEGEPEHHDGENDPDFGGDDDAGEEEEEEGEEEEDTEESFNFEDIEDIDLSPVEQMREYVEKIGDAYKGGKGVLGKNEDGGTFTKSPVAGKNDMGGTTANIARGGTGSEKGTAGGLLNPTTKEDNAGNVNVPGAKSATKLSPVAKGHGAEKKGAGEDAQNKKSIIGSKG